ncbi:hypothetical protein MMC34_005732 [Xylographa carneopallida]|nr:hypothetical protein [Xylographa carneopallida]
MGRWSQYDEDDYRLPVGMQRVDYDADTHTYTYQDTDGSYWEGAPGARYGSLRQEESVKTVVGAACKPLSASRDAEPPSISETANATKNKKNDVPSPGHFPYSQLTASQPNRKHREKEEEEDVLPGDASISSAKQKDRRLFAPFLFLVCLSLLLVYHLLKALPATDPHPESVHYPDPH